jgi:hypothetical protein
MLTQFIKKFAHCLLLLLALSNVALAAEWAFIAETSSRIDGRSILFIDKKSIKETNGKYRFWVQTAAISELKKREHAVIDLQEAIEEKSQSSYMPLGYKANPYVFEKQIDMIARLDLGPLHEDPSARAIIRDLLIRTAIYSEIIVNKTGARPQARIYYEMDMSEKSAKVLQFNDADGGQLDTKQRKIFIPPESPLETIHMLIRNNSDHSPKGRRPVDLKKPIS